MNEVLKVKGSESIYAGEYKGREGERERYTKQIEIQKCRRRLYGNVWVGLWRERREGNIQRGCYIEVHEGSVLGYLAVRTSGREAFTRVRTTVKKDWTEITTN